jgi:hypothetical protein
MVDPNWSVKYLLMNLAHAGNHIACVFTSRVSKRFAAADWNTIESSAQEVGLLLLQDESKFNDCVQPMQATMMPVQDPNRA